MDFPTVTAPRKQPALVSVDGRAFPLRSATIRAHASGGVAATTLIQEFSNPHDEALEVLYTLPLPADGAVMGYTIHVGERVIRGEIEPREKAEKEYREALYAGKTAGLLEEDRADTFTQKLGNIPPRTDVRVEIETLQRLAFLPAVQPGSGADPGDHALWEYCFPTVATVRYQGAPGRVPDAEKISPDRAETGGIPARFELDLTIADETAVDAPVVSRSHQILTDRAAGHTLVRLSEGSPLDRDLVIHWRAVTRDVGVHLTDGPGLPGDDGRYALLTITPPEVPAATFRRDLTILMDTSGSMTGVPLETAKAVATRLLESLAPEDRFEVLEFSNDTRRLTRDLVRATPEAVAECAKKFRVLGAGGGTEMTQALVEALKPKDLAAQRQVVLISDGQIAFEGEVIREILQAASVVTRVHFVGVGFVSNRALGSSVARGGRGAEIHVPEHSGAEDAARRLVAATASPVLTDIQVVSKAIRAQTPERPGDVFAGQPLVMSLELSGTPERIQVSGRVAGSDERWVCWVEVPSTEGPSTIPIGALHGKELIRDLELEEAVHPGSYDADIERIAMRHRIVSRRTSLVAVAEEPSVDPKEPRRRKRLAVEVPFGMSAEGLGLNHLGVSAFLGSSPFVKHAFSPEMRSSVPPQASAPPVPWHQSVLEGSVQYMRDITRGLRPTIYRTTGTVIRSERGGLLVEFEVPVDTLTMDAPGWAPSSATLITGDEIRDRAYRQTLHIVPDESSAMGPHQSHTLIRMQLKTASGKELHALSAVFWVQFTVYAHGDRVELEVRLHTDA